MGPGKLGIVLRRLTFFKHGIKLGYYAGKGGGRRFRQFFEQGLYSVGRLALSKHRGGVPGMPSITTANQKAIRNALEAAGIEFIPANGGGPGVRLAGRFDGG
ncbi:hypothetical protein [Mesorhizobium sp.]|uniref:hypothetical protein n=1 Tax=Mesorhizobium sp. TaxID=1871066 RepID=UPI00258075DE|nr:hypothetical protein [Mesorhizobium sp.]